PRRRRAALRRVAGRAARGRSQGGARGRRARLRDCLRRLPPPQGALMRWLLLKDLQILRRSPLQAVLLVAYPVLIAVLVGFAISRSPEKPRVAFLNEVPSDAAVTVGTTQLPKVGVADRICERVECVKVANREEAVDAVRSG